jgi:hypothetical protein
VVVRQDARPSENGRIHGVALIEARKMHALTPCVKSRGYAQQDPLEGVVITGASLMHERIKQGAATLSF